MKKVGHDQEDDAGRAGDLLGRAAVLDIVDEWGVGSFPASDPPSSWAGEEHSEGSVTPPPHRVAAVAPVPEEDVHHQVHDQS